MSNPLSLFALAAAMMFGTAIVLFLLGFRLDKTVPVARRFDRKLERLQQEKTSATSRFSPMQWGLRMARRAGLELRPGHLTLLMLAFGLLCGIAYSIRGGQGLLAAALAFAIVIYLVTLWRSAATRKRLVQQLPTFLDQIIRTMTVGRSFDSALLQAIHDSPPPLSRALANVEVENALGGDLVASLTDAAQLYRLHELQMITLSLKINQRFGGSIKAMLESIITLIRQRELAERELRALTGETRVSAWVLGIMPSAVAGYMMLQNPGYFDALMKDPNGDAIIYTSLGLQLAGGLIIWRMLRSIQ